MPYNHKNELHNPLAYPLAYIRQTGGIIRTWSGRIVQTVKKPVAETPIFAALEAEKQLTIFSK